MRAITGLVLALAVLMGGCEGGSGRVEESDEGAMVEAPGWAAPELDPLFEEAAREFGVPAPLLKGISYAETRWQMVRGEEEFEGRPAAFGVMGLRGARLEQGAALAGVPAEAVRTDALANIRAAAALLASDAAELGVSGEELGDWAGVVARFSGIENPTAQAHYVRDDVFGALYRAGAIAKAALPELKGCPTTEAVGPDYAAAIWRPSPNFGARPDGSIGVPAMIIIHTCEDSYAHCWSWLTNTASGVSAHYVVNESGSEISQLVTEANRAWHIGASYDCTLNANVECWRNANSVNHFSVGIEHAGFASQTSFPASQINASALLACDISRDRSIPRDRYHIVAHGQLQPWNRTDPGPNWPWTEYLDKINQHCWTSVIIDSNNSNNDTSRGYLALSSNWASSSNVAGYYGSGYYYASTAPISDGAAFWFYLPTAGAHTVDAWWTAASDRSASAPFVVIGADESVLGTVYVSQKVNGGKWNALGTWTFPAGWNRIVLSRWTTEGNVVIADAVRIR
jgi:N-acetyl-anhydromuramyl-L-alanine amidase AmpD